MYPFARLAFTLFKTRRAGAMPFLDTHITQQRCWPWDLDIFLEMNNGRVLTLYDLGRFGLGERTGLMRTLKQQRWGLAVAGASVRYRRRLHAFQRFEMRTRAVGWDERFVYIEQSMWRGEVCTSHLLIRAAITDAKGIVAPERVLKAMGRDAPAPELPDWVAAWVQAEAVRPWPPMSEVETT